VRMELHLGVEVVSVTGVVNRSETDHGMAIEFLDLSPVARSRLGAHLLQADVAEGRRRMSHQIRDATRALPAAQPAAPVAPRTPASPAPSTRLGELLLRRGRVTADQLGALRAEERVYGEALIDLALKLRLLTEDDLVSLLHHEYRLPIVDLTTIDPTRGALRLVPSELARRHDILPIGVAGSTLTVAMSDPSNFDGLNAVKFRSGCDVKIMIAPRGPLRRAIIWFYDERNRQTG